MTQLSVLKDLDASTIPMTQAYAEAVKCEALRADIFAGQRSPLVFGRPGAVDRTHGRALRKAFLQTVLPSRGAQELRGQALESAPATAGDHRRGPFEWIADADGRLGSLLRGRRQRPLLLDTFPPIVRVDIEKPVDLRDIVWMPAHFAWSNGGEAVGLIPTRYPGSETSEDPQIRMARKTDWIGAEGDTWLGLGQRMLATDAGGIPPHGRSRDSPGEIQARARPRVLGAPAPAGRQNGVGRPPDHQRPRAASLG